MISPLGEQTTPVHCSWKMDDRAGGGNLDRLAAPSGPNTADALPASAAIIEPNATVSSGQSGRGQHRCWRGFLMAVEKRSGARVDPNGSRRVGRFDGDISRAAVRKTTDCGVSEANRPDESGPDAAPTEARRRVTRQSRGGITFRARKVLWTALPGTRVPSKCALLGHPRFGGPGAYKGLRPSVSISPSQCFMFMVSPEPHQQAEHMAAPTTAARANKALANQEPFAHGPCRQIQRSSTCRLSGLDRKSPAHGRIDAVDPDAD